MKKLVPLAIIALVIWGCNKEKIYKENLNGKWTLYKYLLNNVDKTTLFQNTYANDTITFTDANTFTETYISPDSAIVLSGTYEFKDNDESLVLTHTVTNIVDSLPVQTSVVRKFRIFNLTGDHVQLRTDTSEQFRVKVKVE